MALLLLGAACGTGLFDVSRAPEPAVQLLLVTGESEHVASVTYTVPARPALPIAAPPVAAESVSLVLAGPDGVQAEFTPVTGSPGRFAATMLAEANTTYQLRGLVAGRNVRGEVTLPQPPIWLEPSLDTIRLGLGDRDAMVPYAWLTSGSAAYVVGAAEASVDEISTLVLLTWETSGVLRVSRFFPGRPDTIEISVTAFEPAAAEFYLAPTDDRALRIGNLEGAHGVFGARSRGAPKVIVWQ